MCHFLYCTDTQHTPKLGIGPPLYDVITVSLFSNLGFGVIVRYSSSEMMFTSEPVSSLNDIVLPSTRRFCDHLSSRVSWPAFTIPTNNSVGSVDSSRDTYRTFVFDLHTRAKCPGLPHALHDLLKAGHARGACAVSQQLHLGRDRFASSGRAFSSAGSRIISLETIDLTETGRRWLTMFTFLRLQSKSYIGQQAVTKKFKIV